MKKKLFVLCLAAGLVLSVNAQEMAKDKEIKDKDLPASVQANFKSQYPDATGTDWKIKDDKYKVHFKLNGTKQLAAYDANGELLMKGVEIKEADLPAPINTAVKAAYTGRTIEEIYKLDKKGTTTYLVKLNGNPGTKVVYSADGQVVTDK